MNLNNMTKDIISDRIKTRAMKKDHGHRNSVLQAETMSKPIVSSP